MLAIHHFYSLKYLPFWSPEIAQNYSLYFEVPIILEIIPAHTYIDSK